MCGKPVRAGAGLKPGSNALVQTSRSFGTTSRMLPPFVIRSPSGDCITLRKMPPGRRSISTSGVVHGAGVNHCISISGVVQAFHTSSRGTSTTRSSTRSSFGSGR